MGSVAGTCHHQSYPSWAVDCAWESLCKLNYYALREPRYNRKVERLDFPHRVLRQPGLPRLHPPLPVTSSRPHHHAHLCSTSAFCACSPLKGCFKPPFALIALEFDFRTPSLLTRFPSLQDQPCAIHQSDLALETQTGISRNNSRCPGQAFAAIVGSTTQRLLVPTVLQRDQER